MALAKKMLLDREQWRADFQLDKLMRCVSTLMLCMMEANGHFKNREFNFTEKKEVDKYYPQYYHKTDKVIRIQLQISCVFISFPGWATSLC